jgi:hypothetical protein
LLNRQTLPWEKEGKKSLGINPDSGASLTATAAAFPAERQIDGVSFFGQHGQNSQPIFDGVAILRVFAKPSFCDKSRNIKTPRKFSGRFAFLCFRECSRRGNLYRITRLL